MRTRRREVETRDRQRQREREGVVTVTAIPPTQGLDAEFARRRFAVPERLLGGHAAACSPSHARTALTGSGSEILSTPDCGVADRLGLNAPSLDDPTSASEPVW